MQMRPLLLGHRGARGEDGIPENTLRAFDLALSSGCDGFEFDVRLTADGQTVVCHDGQTHGMKIAESTSQQLGLPMLAEILARYQKTAWLDIELKVPGLESIAADLLRKYPPARGFVVSSFLPEVLQTIHGMDAKIPLGFIFDTRDHGNHWPGLPVEYVIPHFKLVRQDLIAQIKAAGKKTLVWTVNLPADMQRLAKLGVNGIVSDHPRELARTLAQPDQN